MTDNTHGKPAAAAERFRSSGNIIGIREFGNGNINQTFLVTLNAGGEKHFVLQRINTRVFSRPELIMSNMRIATGHMRQHLQRAPLGEGRRWEVPQVLLTKRGEDHWTDPEGSFWRAISYIENAQSFDTVKDIGHAGEIGYALGIFHNLLSDLPPGLLADTLEGFHITPRYLRHFYKVMEKYSGRKSPEINYCLNFVNARNAWAHVLENARAQGKLSLRTIHGDPKVNNFMIDITTGQAVGIVDLDTVKPGLVHYDIGDCLRSGCNPAGERTENGETVRFDTDFCRAILQGYLLTAKKFLTGSDFDYMFDSVRLLAFELGLRFLTDYLEGNVYFRVGHPEHNLARALVQFKLTESIESQKKTIHNIIGDMR
ncbi:MAG: aminoglycoside phosphotransferase family protein [Nitrospiraceae bacterium]|nr:MAG: aminoglycoside phosphotransferase family protein [Nitrospiraceae bacterium]